ncbi:MAG: Gx transporter family protein [Gammaproteobacteria bacterium]|nr:Gx transporter family protein [Gammaproteobacteria bacterium]
MSGQPNNASERKTGITIKTTQEDHLIAWLAALAIAIHIIESVLPSPLPGVKPGLANVITIAVFILYGWRTAVWVTMLRVLVGSILIGTFLSPTFMLSFSGAVASLIVLWLASRLPGEGPGPIGLCLIAAMAHMSGQFYTAYLLFIPHDGLFKLLPLLMTAAVVFGIISGIIVRSMLQHLEKRKNDTTAQQNEQEK